MFNKFFSIVFIAIFILAVSCVDTKKSETFNNSSKFAFYSEHPEEAVMDQVISLDNNFKEGALKYILGPNYDEEYIVDSNSKTQNELDKAVWGYCASTSHLFGSLCNYMIKNDYNNDNAYNVLFNIVYRQKEYLNKYASDRMKKDARSNTFEFEEKTLSKLVNYTASKQNTIFECIKDI